MLLIEPIIFDEGQVGHLFHDNFNCFLLPLKEPAHPGIRIAVVNAIRRLV